MLVVMLHWLLNKEIIKESYGLEGGVFRIHGLFVLLLINRQTCNDCIYTCLTCFTMSLGWSPQSIWVCICVCVCTVSCANKNFVQSFADKISIHYNVWNLNSTNLIIWQDERIPISRWHSCTYISICQSYTI